MTTKFGKFTYFIVRNFVVIWEAPKNGAICPFGVFPQFHNISRFNLDGGNSALVIGF